MSGTTIDTAPTRRPRGDRPDRQVHREDDAEPQVTIEAPSVSPDDALADVQRQLKQAETDRNAASARANAAEAARLSAERNATTNRVSDRQSAVTSNLEAGKSEVTAAKAAYAAARESGDVSAEIAAQELLAQATFKVQESGRELEWLKNQAEQARAAPAPTQEYKPSDAAQRWLDEHPRFRTDDDYRAAAEGLHGRALAAGKPDGSQDYVDYIEAGMTRLFGEGHGQVGGRSRTVERDDDQPMRGGEGMRPSGGADRNGAGWKNATLPIGHNGSQMEIRYRGPPENRVIQIVGRNQAENLENIREGAQANFSKLYEKNQNKAITEFMNEYIEAAEEGFQDLKRGDGQGWR